MYSNIYEFAGRVIKIESLYERVQHQCRDYVSKEPPEICISITPEDIQNELKKSKGDSTHYSEEYLESLAVYRKLAESLLDYNILLFHGSVVAVDEEAYLFTAKSGTGKSTHTRLWMELFGKRAVMVNDDKPLLELMKDKIIVHGTPWDGKHHLSVNTSVPLKSICMLQRGTENRIEPADRKCSYPILLQQVYRPTEETGVKKTLCLFDELLSKVEVYSLSCNMELNAARIAYTGMNHRIGEKENETE